MKKVLRDIIDKISPVLVKIKDYIIKIYDYVSPKFIALCKEIYKYKFIILPIVLVTMLSIGYIFGTKNNSREIILNKLQTAIKENDSKELRKLVKYKDKKISEEEATNLLNYFNENSDKINNIRYKLSNSDKSNIFNIETKKTFFGNKIQINVNTYSIKINSNFDESTFKLQDITIKTGEEYSDIFPGVYKVKGTLKSDYGDIETSKKIILDNNKNITINFDAVNLTVNTSINDCDLYLNDKKIGNVKENSIIIGPIEANKNNKLHIEKDFPWGHNIGEDVVVTNVPSVNLSVNIQNDKLVEELDDAVNQFYDGVFEALNEENKNKIKKASDNAKDKIYGILENDYFILKNKYTINKIKILDENSEFNYEDNVYKATIVVNMDYTISKKFFGINKSTNNKSFFTKLIYKNDQWIIDDVDNFNL